MTITECVEVLEMPTFAEVTVATGFLRVAQMIGAEATLDDFLVRGKKDDAGLGRRSN